MTLLQVFETTVVLSLLLVVAGAVRRLYFHPLAHIPGPRLAAITWWYEFYFDVIQPSTFVFKIQELHKQYGPIVRITPDEIHVNDVGFLETIYAPSMFHRDKYGYILRTLRIPGAIGAIVRHDVHRKRREVLGPFFSKRNVLHLEPPDQQKAREIVVTNNFLFAHQTDVLAGETLAATLRQNGNDLLLGININKHFPWFPDFLESLPLFISKPIMPPGLVDMLALFDRVRAELQTGIVAAKSSCISSEKQLGPTGKESVYHSVLDSNVLPPEEKSLLCLEQEGALLAELSTVPKTASWSELEKLPYLSAVLEEGNRLSWGVTARTARIADETLKYTPSAYAASPGKSYAIPPGTPISTTTLSAHTAESVFPEPFTFDPERWLGDAGSERRKFQMAFGKGERKCIGIELARAELYLVTAALIRGFEMELWETDESEVAFVHDYQVAMPEFGSKGAMNTRGGLAHGQGPGPQDASNAANNGAGE
ncbi:Cytochrome P450 monooxygenase [Lachnellula willkommii]|uniref:Cytochrome P450 monooxygenase n=1 Tax=Lachnellula willkommii TaxID=215461 RepID=A0A559MAX5_9HELO|nr:Cytochrome P450 monooxygenase [Lachnellula willkommii]